MKRGLARLCASHGIQPSYLDMDGVERSVPEDTLAALAEVFGLDRPAREPPASIDEALAEPAAPRCHIPRALRKARLWGLTCQLPSLASSRNLGMGDFADLAALCRLAAAEGADFLGLNPLHALFWSDPGRISPFFPSNRRFLNPLYIAVDWVEGFTGLRPAEARAAARLRRPPLIDIPAVARLKDRVLRRLFEAYPWDGGSRRAFRRFCKAGGDALRAHALFEALSEAMVAEGHGAGWQAWPAALRDRRGPAVAAFRAAHAAAIDYHLWLQWLADAQLGRAQREAEQAGMRLGLYLDFAVGAAPDGSATWTDPELIVPSLSIGAPPDAFSTGGQDWGLAPLSPPRLADHDGLPFSETMRAVLQHAGAARIDHAMSLLRLWLIPRGRPATEGAYVRYPLSLLLAGMAQASRDARAIVIGEDLGVVPAGFRDLMAARHFHGYRVFYFEFGPEGLHDWAAWPADALACLATHDMPTFAGWWSGSDLDLRRALGMLTAKDLRRERRTREAERRALRDLLGGGADPVALSVALHGLIGRSPCRLVALQIEDALGLPDQVNIPGTIDEHPNWRRRLPVALDRLADHPGFRAHTAALRLARPR